jgi:hypothetical protein
LSYVKLFKAKSNDSAPGNNSSSSISQKKSYCPENERIGEPAELSGSKTHPTSVAALQACHPRPFRTNRPSRAGQKPITLQPTGMWSIALYKKRIFAIASPNLLQIWPY